MIIVSQDKSVIINLNNVEAIEIGNVEENRYAGTIYAKLTSGYFYKIGEYKKEERAKEVLQEIIKAYKNEGLRKIDTIMIDEKVVFEIPEE